MRLRAAFGCNVRESVQRYAKPHATNEPRFIGRQPRSKSVSQNLGHIGRPRPDAAKARPRGIKTQDWGSRSFPARIAYPSTALTSTSGFSTLDPSEGESKNATNTVARSRGKHPVPRFYSQATRPHGEHPDSRSRSALLQRGGLCPTRDRPPGNAPRRGAHQ